MISTISCKDPESIALATSRGSLHKYVEELYPSGKHWPAMKFSYRKDFQSVEIPQWPNINYPHSDKQIWPCMSKFQSFQIAPTDSASMILA